MFDTENDILDADEAAVLLYVAGEMGEADRRSFESRLKSDAGLRTRLDETTAFDDEMRAEASLRPVDGTDSRLALANSIRLVREQALVLQTRPMRISRRRLAGVPRWAWGSAVAASVAVGALVWISNSDPPQINPNSELRAANNDLNPFPNPSDMRAFASGFLPIQAEGTESATTEINSQLDALDTLAVMDERTLDVSDSNTTP